MQIVLHLLWEDRQLNVDAGAFTVRPPAAPTTEGQDEARAQGLSVRPGRPEARRGPWRSVNPVTGENHLRHAKLIALRDDKPAREVMRE